MDTAKIITLLKSQNGLEVFNYYFVDFLDGAWLNCFVTMYPKKLDGVTPIDSMLSPLRNLRDKKPLEEFGYECVNQWFPTGVESSFSRFEPPRLVYSKNIAKKHATKKITFTPDPRILRRKSLISKDSTVLIDRKVSIFIFASKERADEFLSSGKNLMVDMTTT